MVTVDGDLEKTPYQQDEALWRYKRDWDQIVSINGRRYVCGGCNVCRQLILAEIMIMIQITKLQKKTMLRSQVLGLKQFHKGPGGFRKGLL